MTKGDDLYEELAHYSIEKFITNHRYHEIIDNDIRDPEFGHCRGFILGIMRNSWYGKKSEFRRINANHRADIGSRKKGLSEQALEDRINTISELHSDFTLHNNEGYDYGKDYLIEAIEGILEEMSIDTKKQWYNAKLFQMYLENPNFSAISRETGIPRTSISNAVEETKQFIIEELKNRGINYE